MADWAEGDGMASDVEGVMHSAGDLVGVLTHIRHLPQGGGWLSGGGQHPQLEVPTLTRAVSDASILPLLLAQSEACHGCHQWVNYFLHAGHLNIRGLKMSKSLKNFVTIRQALAEHTPRQLRLMFLLQPWDRAMYYSDQVRERGR
jgi:hypothetical protein